MTIDREMQKAAKRAAKEISNNGAVLAVILYGSVARGQSDRRSDIDLLLIYERGMSQRKLLDVEMTLTSKYGFSFHLMGLTKKNIEKESIPSYLESILKEGIVLFSRATLILPTGRKLGLMPFYLVSYSLEKISNSKKPSICHKLLGYSKVVGAKKREYGGLLKTLGARRVSKGAFIISAAKSEEIFGFFQNNKIVYRTEKIWIETSRL